MKNFLALVLVFVAVIASSCETNSEYSRTDIISYPAVSVVMKTDTTFVSSYNLRDSINDILRDAMTDYDVDFRSTFSGYGSYRYEVDFSIKEDVEIVYPSILGKIYASGIDFEEVLTSSSLPEYFGGEVAVILIPYNTSRGMYYTSLADTVGIYTIEFLEAGVTE